MVYKVPPYIAELHDIGKLADWQALQNGGLKVAGHTYNNFDFAQLNIKPPSSPSWWGQWSGNIKSLDATRGLPDGITDDGKACVILTKIADELAASISRTLVEFSNEFKKLRKEGKLAVEGLRLLWNPGYYDNAIKEGKHWAAFRTPDELRQMFVFIEKCQNPEEFFVKYRDNLRLTPEDKSTPLNFISLETHLDLTGKIFRVLRYWAKLIVDNGKLRLEYDRQKIAQLIEAAGDRAQGNNKGKWVYRLVQCRVFFPQSLVRLQDLNILNLRQEKIKEVVEKQKINGDVERQRYAVLFYTDDFLSLFLPKESFLPLRQVVEPLLEEGFWLLCEELEAELNLLTSTGAITRRQLIVKYGDRSKARARRYFELRERSLWPDLDEVIAPPLCELCQQRQGEVYIKDRVREWLCPACRMVREMGEPASAISDWEEHDRPVAWLKVSLDQKILLQCLQRLFENHVDNGPGMHQVRNSDRQAIKEGFRPLAAQMQFAQEYREFLKEFQALLRGEKEYALKKVLCVEQDALLYPVEKYKELMVIRLDHQRTLGMILDAFYSLLLKYFPECLVDCPVCLAVSLSNVKYPYQEHWRFFEAGQLPGVIFYLQQPGIRSLRLTAPQFRALREKLKGKRLNHFLHRLAAIEAQAGELMAMTQALRQINEFPQLKKLLWRHGLSFRQILNYAELVGVTMEEVMACGG